MEASQAQSLANVAMAGAQGAASYGGTKAGEAIYNRLTRPTASAEGLMPPSLAPSSYQGSMRAPMSYQGSLGVRSEYGSTVDLGNGMAGIRGPRPFGEMSSSGAPSVAPSEVGFESARGSSLMDANGRMSEWFDSLPSSRASSISDTLSRRTSVMSDATESTIPRSAIRGGLPGRPMTRLPRNWLDPEGPALSDASTISVSSERFTPSEAERQLFGPRGNPAFPRQSIVSQRPVMEPPGQEMTTISQTEYNQVRASVMAEEEGRIARGYTAPNFEESQTMIQSNQSLAEVRTAARMRNLRPMTSTGREGLQRLGRRGVSRFDQFERPTGFRSQMPMESRALDYSAPRTIPMSESVGGASAVEMTPMSATEVGGGAAAEAESAAVAAETSLAGEVAGATALTEVAEVAAVAL